MAGVYTESVEFYGNVISATAVMEEKRKFAQRWPIRDYSFRDGSLTVNCVGSDCNVSAIVDWFAHSPSRAKSSNGVAAFDFQLNTERLSITSESGSVLREQVANPDAMLIRWRDQNEKCRGGTGDAPETWQACDARDHIEMSLAAAGCAMGVMENTVTKCSGTGVTPNHYEIEHAHTLAAAGRPSWGRVRTVRFWGMLGGKLPFWVCLIRQLCSVSLRPLPESRQSAPERLRWDGSPEWGSEAAAARLWRRPHGGYTSAMPSRCSGAAARWHLLHLLRGTQDEAWALGALTTREVRRSDRNCYVMRVPTRYLSFLSGGAIAAGEGVLRDR